MLYTIKQIKRNFVNCIYLGFAESLGNNDLLKDSMDGSKTLKEKNMKMVLDWLDSHTGENGKLDIKRDTTQYLNPVTVARGLGIDSKTLTSKKIDELKRILSFYVEGEKKVTEQVKEKTKFIKAERKKVKYKVRDGQEIPLRNEDSIYQKEEREDVDIKNIDPLIRKIQKALDNGGFVVNGRLIQKSYELRYYLTSQPSKTRRRMEKIAKQFGYKDSRGFLTRLFDSYEDVAEVVVSRLDNTRKLRDLLDGNLDEESKTYVILDYIADINSDGKIRIDTRDGVEEIRISEYIKNTTDIKNLLTNLGFSEDLNQFGKGAFKETFNDRLIETVKMGVPLEVLTKKGGYKEFMNEYLKREAELRKQVEEEVTRQNKKLKETVTKKARSNKDIKRDPNDKELEIARTLTIGASFGHLKSIGVRTDISKLVGGIIDGLNVGASGDGIGIALDKNLIKKQLGAYEARVDGLLTPKGLGVSGAINRDIFNEINDNNLNVTAGAGVGLGHTGYMLTVKEKATDNPDGINSIMKRDSKVFDSVIGLIEEGVLTDSKKLKTSYLISLFNKNIVGQGLSEKQANIARENIQEIINKYNALIKPLDGDNKKLATKHFKKAILANMMNKMYEGQAKGLKLTGVGGFLIPGVVGGIFPIFEYNWTSFNKRKDKISEEIVQEITSMPLAEFIKKYGNTQGVDYLKMQGDSLIVKKELIKSPDEFDEGIISKRDGENIIISPKKGYNLYVNASQRYKSDTENNGVSKIYGLDIRSQKVSEEREFKEVAGDKFSDLREELNRTEAGFTSKTRHNIKFLRNQKLLNPEASLEDRWNSLIELLSFAYKRKDRRYNGIAGIGALGKTNLGKIIAKATVAKNSNEQKKYIISRVNQFMKKAADFDDGSIESWNKKTDKFISTDKARSYKFDKIWEEKGLDLKTERKSYYEKLKQVGDIKKATVPGLSFDAAATLVNGKSDKGVDVMKGDIDALANVDGRIIATEITDPKKIAILKELVKQKVKIENTDGIKFFLYKDPQGFNDRIMVLRELPKGGKITGKGSSWGDIVDQKNHTATLIPAWTWDEENKTETVVEEKIEEEKQPKKTKKPKDPEEDKVTTNPEEDTVTTNPEETPEPIPGKTPDPIPGKKPDPIPGKKPNIGSNPGNSKTDGIKGGPAVNSNGATNSNNTPNINPTGKTDVKHGEITDKGKDGGIFSGS